jgi:hypothetical protein
MMVRWLLIYFLVVGGLKKGFRREQLQRLGALATRRSEAQLVAVDLSIMAGQRSDRFPRTLDACVPARKSPTETEQDTIESIVSTDTF